MKKQKVMGRSFVQYTERVKVFLEKCLKNIQGLIALVLVMGLLGVSIGTTTMAFAEASVEQASFFEVSLEVEIEEDEDLEEDYHPSEDLEEDYHPSEDLEEESCPNGDSQEGACSEESSGNDFLYGENEFLEEYPEQDEYLDELEEIEAMLGELELEEFEEIMALAACGVEVASGNFGSVTAGNSPTGVAVPGAEWVFCGCGVVTVGGGGLQMPDNTNTLTQNAFPAAIRPLITQVNFTEPIIAGTSLQCLFHGLTSLTSIQGMGNIDTSRVRNFRRMFMYTSSLGSLDLSGMNTSAATNMYRMFHNTGAVSLNLGGSFNTGGQVDNMGSMFWGASNLVSIGDVGNWNTGNVTRMSRLFQEANSLGNLNLSSWNTSNVTLMYNMFQGATSMTQINVNSWNVSNVVRMDNMFNRVSGVSHLDLSNWNTASLQRMDNMFDNNAPNLVRLDLNNFNTSGVVNRNNMLNQSNALPLSLQVLVLGPNWYWNAFNPSGLRNPPENDYFYGNWRNVGDGTIHNPLGEHIVSSLGLFNNSLFPSNIVNVWVWNPRSPQFVVSFVADDNGVVTDPSANPLTLVSANLGVVGTDMTIQVMADENFEFSHWISDQHLGEFNTDELRNLPITADTVFTAVFTPIIHPVKFKLNGGRVGGDELYIRHEIKQGNLVTSSNVPVPIRPGYRFLGWYQYNSPAGPPMLSGDVIAIQEVIAPLAFEAQWERIVLNHPNVPNEPPINDGNDDSNDDSNDDDNDDNDNDNDDNDGKDDENDLKEASKPSGNHDVGSGSRSPQTGDSDLPLVRYLISALVSIFLLRLLFRGKSEEEINEQFES